MKQVSNLALAFSVLTLASSGHAATATCDKACLKGVADRYLAALQTHDPSRAGLAADVKTTQNGAAVKPGAGLWQSAAAVGRRRYVYDPETGNVAVQAALQSNGNPAIVLVRLQVAGGKIEQQEIILAEKGKLAPRIWNDFDAFAAEQQPEWDAAIAPSQRATREELLRVAGSYFEGLNNAGTPQFKVAEFSPATCNRFENGQQVTNAPFLGRPPATCIDQFAMLGRSASGSIKIIGRRFPLVDVEKGIVLGIGVMKVDAPGTTGNQPEGALVGDLYKIENHKITLAQITYDRTQAADGGTGW